MGKGDKRTRRGKIYKGSYGKTRPILHAGIPDRQQLCRQARLQRMRAEGAEHDASRGEQRAQRDDDLRAQDFFFACFTRCGRVLP